MSRATFGHAATMNTGLRAAVAAAAGTVAVSQFISAGNTLVLQACNAQDPLQQFTQPTAQDPTIRPVTDGL